MLNKESPSGKSVTPLSLLLPVGFRELLEGMAAQLDKSNWRLIFGTMALTAAPSPEKSVYQDVGGAQRFRCIL